MTDPSASSSGPPGTGPSVREQANGRRQRVRRRMPSLAVLPTLCTLGNLVAGFAAIFYATRPTTYDPNEWTGLTMAGVLVFVGMLLDAIDGSIARLTQSTSDLGGQLDSFADMITFGVAPAFMTLMLVNQYIVPEAGPALMGASKLLGPEADTVLGRIIWGAAAVYVCCAALRLARFNVEVGAVSHHGRFRGLPSPGAAGCIASLVILHQHLVVARWLGTEVPLTYARAAALGIPFIMGLCGILMVSSISYVHFANRFLHGSKSFGYVARTVVVIVLAVWWFQETLALAFTAYVLTGPLAMLWSRKVDDDDPVAAEP